MAFCYYFTIIVCYKKLKKLKNTKKYMRFAYSGKKQYLCGRKIIVTYEKYRSACPFGLFGGIDRLCLNSRSKRLQRDTGYYK